MTPRESECLQAIKDLTVDGVPPKYDVLATHLGLKSKSGVWRMIESLVAQGFLRKRFGKNTSLIVVDHPVIFDQDLNRMTEADLVALELHYAGMLRREAKSRAKRYPAIADQLTKWADAAIARAETVRCGPLFSEKAP